MKNEDRVSALLVAHPGHELRLLGWIGRQRPTVFVLTDGSGNSGRSRLPFTTRVLSRYDAAPGSIYGRLTDAELYAIILGGARDRLCELASELADQLGRLRVRVLVADAVEGYNPSHDLCQYLARAAARLSEQQTGRRVDCHQYAVVGHPCGDETSSGGEVVRIRLDPEAAAHKLTEARDYEGLERDVQEAMERYGSAAFAVECLRGGDLSREEEQLARQPPFYETHGEQRVTSGHYATVIRYQEHVLPLIHALESLGR